MVTSWLVKKRQQAVALKASRARGLEKFAVQDLERHGAITHINLLGEEDCAHVLSAEAADKAEATRQPGGKLRLGLPSLTGEAGAIARTVGKIVRIGKLASETSLHQRRQSSSPENRILAEVAARWEEYEPEFYDPWYEP